MLKLITCLAVTALALAYILDEDCPEEFTQMWKVKLFLAACRQSAVIKTVLKLFGHQEHIAFRKTCIITTYFFPNYYASDPGIQIKQDVFDGVPVYVYVPVDVKTGKRRGLVYFHGGGWTVGSIEHYHTELLRMSRHLDAVVIFPVYSLAPEAPFPASYDDCVTVTKYVLHHAGGLGVQADRVALMGDSSGGNLAAVVSYHLKTNHFKPMPKLQVLVFPVLQGEDLDTPSYSYNKDGPFLTRQGMAFFLASYLIGGEHYQDYIQPLVENSHTTAAVKTENYKSYFSPEALPKDDEIMRSYQLSLNHGNKTLWKMMKKTLRDPRFTPMYVDDLSGLPPAYVTTCQYDVLRDEGFFYVKRLREAGVKVEHVNLPCFHCWTQLHGHVDSINRDYKEMLNFIDDNL